MACNLAGMRTRAPLGALRGKHMSTTITNRVCLAGSKGTKVKAALISNNDAMRGNGVLVSEGKRAIVGASYAAVLGAFMRRPNAPHANAVGHGLRLMEGGVSPGFMDKNGASSGAIFCWKGHAKRDALRAAFLVHGVGEDACNGATFLESRKCGGSTLTFPRPLNDREAGAVWDVLAATCPSTGGGNAYNPEGLGALCEAVEIASGDAIPQASVEAASVEAASVEAASVPTHAPTGKRAKRIAAQNKAQA